MTLLQYIQYKQYIQFMPHLHKQVNYIRYQIYLSNRSNRSNISKTPQNVWYNSICWIFTSRSRAGKVAWFFIVCTSLDKYLQKIFKFRPAKKIRHKTYNCGEFVWSFSFHGNVFLLVWIWSEYQEYLYIFSFSDHSFKLGEPYFLSFFACMPCHRHLPHPWLLLPLEGLPIHEQGDHQENHLPWLPKSLSLSAKGPWDRSQLRLDEDGKDEPDGRANRNIDREGGQDIHS